MWEPHLEHSDRMSSRRHKKWLLAKAKEKICSLITVIKSQYFIYSPFTHHPMVNEHKCGGCCCWSSVRTFNGTESDCNAGKTNLIAQYNVHTVHHIRPKQSVKLTVTSVWIWDLKWCMNDYYTVVSHRSSNHIYLIYSALTISSIL